MIEPRREAILIRVNETQPYVNKTADVRFYAQSVDGKIDVTFKSRPTKYSHSPERVLILRNPAVIPIDSTVEVRIDGDAWSNATEVRIFGRPQEA